MATLQIRVKNGLFVATNNCCVDAFDSTYVHANGWYCYINQDGSITCNAKENYSDGIHSIRYEILANGFARLSLKVPYTNITTLKQGFVIPKGARLCNGLVGLSDGNIDNRYAYFRDITFLRFMDKFGITSVKHENPNQNYCGFIKIPDCGNVYQEIFSDGQIRWLYKHTPQKKFFHKKSSESNSDFYPGTIYHTVSDASWVIIERHAESDSNNAVSRILYTSSENILDLESLLMMHPAVSKYVHNKEQAKRLEELNGREVHTLTDIKSVVDEVLSIAPRMKCTITSDEAIEAFLKFYSIEGYRFIIETCGPLSNTFADYDVNVVCTNGYSVFDKQVKIATGFLG